MLRNGGEKTARNNFGDDDRVHKRRTDYVHNQMGKRESMSIIIIIAVATIVGICVLLAGHSKAVQEQEQKIAEVLLKKGIDNKNANRY